jgi:ribulose-5-phosphate 4-epimerase/fuculose-1-phosphate aldolase
LRNHGLITVASTIHKALQRMIYLEEACGIQLDVYKTGRPVRMSPHEVSEATARIWEERTAGNDSAASDDIEWAALLRLCDRLYPDYRT